MTKKVYIIILNYNGWKDTIECLESVLKSAYDNYQVIVVDNDSPNNSMDYIINWAEGRQEVIYDESSQLKHLSQPFEAKPLEYVYYTKEEAISGGDAKKENGLKNPLIFIQAGENRGFAAGNNIGIKYAFAKDDFKYICLINNDTVVEKDFLSLIITRMWEKNEVGICASKINYYSKPKLIWSNGGVFRECISQTTHIDYQKCDYGQAPSSKVSFLTGCMWVIKKEVFKSIGLLNEDYFMYVEDLEYSYKVLKAGYKLEVEARSIIYHKVGSSSKGEISVFSSYWMMKNRVKFILDHAPFFYKITSIAFILLTRIIRFPKWYFEKKADIIKSQINGFYEGMLNK